VLLEFVKNLLWKFDVFSLAPSLLRDFDVDVAQTSRCEIIGKGFFKAGALKIEVTLRRIADEQEANMLGLLLEPQVASIFAWTFFEAWVSAQLHDFHAPGEWKRLSEESITVLFYEALPSSKEQDAVIRKIAKAWKVDFDKFKEMIGKFLATPLYQECEPDVDSFLRQQPQWFFSLEMDA
jgi:hypothetical protein